MPRRLFASPRWFVAACATLVGAACAEPVPSPSHPTHPRRQPRADGTAAPFPGLAFEPNRGQLDPAVHFWGRDRGATVFFTAAEVVLVLPPTASQSIDGAPRVADVVRMRLRGANPAPHIVGLDRVPGVVHHYEGGDASTWRTDVPTFGRVQYDGVYPGVDLVFHAEDGRLAYDFIVAPGADTGALRLAFAGAEVVGPGADGALGLRSRNGTTRLLAPLSYQDAGGATRPVDSHFVVAAGEVQLALAAYDRGRELVIDPALEYASYLGGTGNEAPTDDPSYLRAGFGVDATGAAYVAGTTESSDYPELNASTTVVTRQAFVTKIAADGGSIVFSMFLGAPAGPFSRDTKVTDLSSNGWQIAVVGWTGAHDDTGTPESEGFPCTQLSGENGQTRAFVTWLTPAGDIDASLCFGGGSRGLGGTTIATHVSVGDDLADAWVVGFTNAVPGDPDVPAGTELPLVAPWRATPGGTFDYFAARLTRTGIAYSTFLGLDVADNSPLAPGPDVVSGIDVDGLGNLYLTGTTTSATFTTTPGAFQTTKGLYKDAWAHKHDANGALVWSTLFGGSGQDQGKAIVAGRADVTWVTGQATSEDLPLTPGASSIGNTFFTGLSPAGDALVYSTRFPAFDTTDLVLDYTGKVHLAGTVGSIDGLPVTSEAPQDSFGGGSHDAYAATFVPDSHTFSFATYLGGSDTEEAYGLAVDDTGHLHVLGGTWSNDFPVLGPFQATHAGDWDFFVARIEGPPRNVVVTVADAGAGSLRDAIDYANANPGTTITFEIAIDQGTDGTEIDLSTPLPPLTAAGTVVDGTTQPASGLEGPGEPTLTVRGAASLGNGIDVQADDVAVRGLTIVGFASGAGVSTVAAGTVVQTCVLSGNATGLLIDSPASLATVGGAGTLANGLRGNDVGLIVRGSFNRVLGNRVGTDNAGNQSLGNQTGIRVEDGGDNVIGGTTAGERNLISGNLQNDVEIIGGDGTIVRGNLIGSNAAGTAPIGSPAAAYGVRVTGGTGTVVGGSSGLSDEGPCTGDCNLICGHTTFGVSLGQDATTLQGNFIGTDVSGLAACGNTSGVEIAASFVEVTRNLIAGNEAYGIRMASDTPSSPLTANVIRGNVIGAGADRLVRLGQPSGGIVASDVVDTIVGGTAPGDANLIAFNLLGVELADGAFAVEVRGNQIYANDLLAITLDLEAPDGELLPAPPNDSLDADVGPNGFQNTPELTSVSITGNTVTVGGAFASAPNQDYQLDLFANPACKASGRGDGERYLGAQGVHTDGAGNATFSVTLPLPDPRFVIFAATATGPDGTSELSPCAPQSMSVTAATTTPEEVPVTSVIEDLEAIPTFSVLNSTVAPQDDPFRGVGIGAARLTNVTVAASGNGDDVRDIAGVTLWADAGAPGRDAADTALANGTFTTDDGSINLMPATPPVIMPGESGMYYVTVSFTPPAGGDAPGLPPATPLWPWAVALLALAWAWPRGRRSPRLAVLALAASVACGGGGGSGGAGGGGAGGSGGNVSPGMRDYELRVTAISADIDTGGQLEIVGLPIVGSRFTMER